MLRGVEGNIRGHITPDGRSAYVTNSASDAETAIDAGTLSKSADIGAGETPVAVFFHFLLLLILFRLIPLIKPAQATQ